MDKLPVRYKNTVIEKMFTGKKGDKKLDRQALVFRCMDAALYTEDFDVPGKLDYGSSAGNRVTQANITELFVAIDKHDVKYIVVMGHETPDGACGMSRVSEHEEHIAEKIARRRGVSVEKVMPLVVKYMSEEDIGDPRQNVVNQLKWLKSLEENDVSIVPKDMDLVGMYYTKDRKVELLAWTEEGRLMRYAPGGKVEQLG